MSARDRSSVCVNIRNRNVNIAMWTTTARYRYSLPQFQLRAAFRTLPEIHIGYFFSTDFCFAHRFFCAAEIFALAAADILRRLRGERLSPVLGIAGLTAPPKLKDEIAFLTPASC